MRVFKNLFIICCSVGIGYYVGGRNSKSFERHCPTEGTAKLVSSSYKTDETVCVYMEPLKTYGRRLKRVKV